MARYTVHPAEQDHRRAHVVEAQDFEDAALAFAELWHPPADHGQTVKLTVHDDRGHSQCIIVDLEDGQAGPCH